MNRRDVVAGLVALPGFSLVAAKAPPAPPLRGGARRADSRESGTQTAIIALAPSGPVGSNADGQVMENLDIEAQSGNGITVTHSNVTIRNCRIRHAGGHGVHAEGAAGLVLQDLDIDHVGAPPTGVGRNEKRNNINLESCPRAVITRVKASRGSSNIYALSSERSRMALLELHDARGPFPRGQNLQLHGCPNSTVEEFSAENGPASWTEDNISVFRSDGCVVRRGLVHYNNSPTGDAVMIEGSVECLVEDVDAEEQGNGAFAAVPQGNAGCGGCTFLRCRTRQTYNTARDGRAPPSSNGLSIYTRISPGARKHTITDCHYDALANPRNLIWDLRAVNPGWSFTRQAFAPRRPIRLVFNW